MTLEETARQPKELAVSPVHDELKRLATEGLATKRVRDRQKQERDAQNRERMFLLD